jgi:hypothetical protein
LEQLAARIDGGAFELQRCREVGAELGFLYYFLSVLFSLPTAPFYFFSVLRFCLPVPFHACSSFGDDGNFGFCGFGD